ncbi:RNA polymerase sigma factor [Steroidobacter cummioxidans]|uniref:RNA polymerase sigma factor n=1 Tax=Steroidobacter cummioxidans TaxID=1803913 RepID=UPI000E314D4A|nr:sigma-70 family RNA polymerase sigma factor [Steroidobacter cummioxidans]
MVDGSNTTRTRFSRPELARLAREQYWTALYAHISHRVESRHDVEDLRQSTVVRVLEGNSEIVITDNPRRFLLNVANGEIVDFYKRRAKDRTHIVLTDDIEQLMDDTEVANSELWPAEDIAERHQHSDSLRRTEIAMSRLPPLFSVPLLLFAHEGLSYAAIGAALKISEEGVKKRIQRARALLRSYLFSEER